MDARTKVAMKQEYRATLDELEAAFSHHDEKHRQALKDKDLGLAAHHYYVAVGIGHAMQIVKTRCERL